MPSLTITKKKVSNNKNFEVKSDVSIDDVINVFEFNVSDLKRESDILDDLHDSLVEEKEDKKIIPQQEHKVRRKKKKFRYKPEKLEIYNCYIFRPGNRGNRKIPRVEN